MNDTWTVLLTFAATTLLVSGVVSLANDVFFRYRGLVGDRLDELSGKIKTDQQGSLFNNLALLSEQASSTQDSWRTRLREALDQSGLRVRVVTLFLIGCGLGMALGIVAAVLTQRPWLSPIGIVPGMLAPFAYVGLKRARRIRRLTMQLPEAFDVIGRAVRAGQTVPAAFQIVADDLESPIAEEFQQCNEQQNLGMPYDTVLRNLARRTGIMELRILVVALLVQSRTGGNLVELLNNLSAMARKRIKLQQRVRALTGEGRLQAMVLIVLPILAFLCILVISPDYGSVLIERPSLLACTLAAQFVGALWIRRIVNFDF